MNEVIVARFWSRVDRNGPVVRPELGPCWLWIANRNPKGYGLFWNGRTTVIATHFALELIGVTVPTGAMACHSCDNPPCVNYGHLFVGDNSINQLDSFQKGRRDFRGEGCPRAKLTAIDVLEIRRRAVDENLSNAELAKLYNVCEATISHIITRRNWKHI